MGSIRGSPGAVFKYVVEGALSSLPESAAYIVCESLGLGTSSYSFAYLAGWAEKAEEVVTAAERACKLADQIMDKITTNGSITSHRS